MIRNLDDAALILAQGQENSARKDLSFIEKANFARQMRDAGYERKIIGDALSMDKTLVSRLLSVADQVPLQLIKAIGSAPSVGRDRWLKLAELLQGKDMTAQAIGETSDARFDAVMSMLLPPKLPARPAVDIRDEENDVVAKVTQSEFRTTISMSRGVDHGFDDWLVENLSEIHRDWKARRGG